MLAKNQIEQIIQAIQCFGLVITLFISCLARGAELVPGMPLFHLHRGYLEGGKNVENTIAAFRAAKKYGQDMIELDVRFSKDHVVMVYHDDNLVRLSNVNRKVSDLTVQELSAYSIPTLEDVLTDPEIPSWLSIELKNDEREDLGFEKAVVAIIKAVRADKRVIVTSFNETALGRVAAIAPEIPRAYLTAKNDKTETDQQFIERVASPLKMAQTKILSLYHVPITASLAVALRQNGLSFVAWTINDEVTAREKLGLGAIGIVTDSVNLTP